MGRSIQMDTCFDLIQVDLYT